MRTTAPSHSGEKSEMKLGLTLSTQGYIDVHSTIQEWGPKPTALVVLESATDIVLDLLLVTCTLCLQSTM